MQRVSFNNFPAQWASEREILLPQIEAVFAKGDFIGGKAVSALEIKLARHLGVAHIVALNSGTDALIFGLKALGVRPGDEVITPANSFIASTAAISHIGAVPVFADIADDQNLDPDAVSAAITPRTVAIMPVHLTGRMADMTRIMQIARRHGLKVIEDAAQAAGALYEGRHPGSIGDIGCFSTHPLKNLNAAGDGGFISTNDPEVAERILRLRGHGLLNRDTALEFGFASRLDTVQAVVLSHRLDQLEQVVTQRNANAALYLSLLEPALTAHLVERPNTRDAYHLFVIQTDQRDALKTHLAEQGVDTKIHYPTPIHQQPAAQCFLNRQGPLPNTERQAKRILSLPINQHLRETEIRYVASLVNDFVERTQSRLSAAE
jgi:dTDP-4-amino-4,6-dideoxygalactose transaminase